MTAPDSATPKSAGGSKAPPATRGGGGAASGREIVGRQWTSRELLRWDWDPRAAHAIAARAGGQVLTAAEALAALAGDDPRPLLVLRECVDCEGTEDAFLSREFDNEKSILLGRWFHAVKLPAAVLEPDHPLHALFDGPSPPHLFTATLDGTSTVPLDGRQSQAQLWKAMTVVLRKAYVKDPESAVGKLRALLDKLDGLDARLAELEERQFGTQADTPAGKELARDHARLVAEREALLKQGAAVEDLKLRSAPGS